MSEGVVNKRATDSSLEKINDAVLSESIFGRMFGFGDLDVLTASEEGDRAPADAEGREGVQEGDARVQARAGDRARPRPTMPPVRCPAAPRLRRPAPPRRPRRRLETADEVADALERLADLRDRGLITPEEFEAKRKEMLARL